MLHSTLCVFVLVAFSVSSSLPTSQMECHKSLFYFVVGIFSFVSLSLSTANPCDSIQMFLPLICLYCWMSAAAGLFKVSHIQLNPASALAALPGSIILFQVSHIQHCIVSPQASSPAQYRTWPDSSSELLMKVLPRNINGCSSKSK